MREVVIEKLQDLAITMLDTKNDIDEIDIEKTLNIFIPTLECFLPEVKQLPITVGEREKVISDLEKRYDIHMDMGTMLLDESEYKKWYYSSKSERGTKWFGNTFFDKIYKVSFLSFCVSSRLPLTMSLHGYEYGRSRQK